MLNIYKQQQVDEMLCKLKQRAENPPDEIISAVTKVINDVKVNGDEAVKRYCRQFDKIELDSLYLSESDKSTLKSKVPSELRAAIERAAANIYDFHSRQKSQSWVNMADRKVMGQRIIPLRRVGMYVPGGTAAYPSSVLMNAIPAKVAGVEDLLLATPPKIDNLNPAVVYAAEVAGVNNILTVGGAQAIAALAYGTESIERVDKIVGPGNIFVATAKRMVYGTVDIDMIAGPSEILIIADQNSNPKFIAADLMSQAEHDPMAASILITTSTELIYKVIDEINLQIKDLTRKDIIIKSLTDNGAAVIVDSLKTAVEISNIIAPEHLELAIANPFDLLGFVKNAGSVFMGEYSPEPLGDYYAGPNHILPTNGTARFASALSVDSFVKRSSYLYYTPESLKAVKDDVMIFANSEGLDAHSNSIKVRFNS